MSRFIFTLSTVVALSVSALADQTKPASEFQKEVRVPSNIGFATDVSDDGQVVTVLFDNVYIALDPARSTSAGTANQTEIQTKVVTLNIPYSTKQRSVKMTMDIRGFADADSGATARLVACAGDSTTSVGLASKTDEAVKLKGTSKDAIAANHAGMELGDFENRVTFTVQTHAAKPVCQITLFLVVDRDTDTADSGGALLAVDSLDIQMATPGKAKYQR